MDIITSHGRMLKYYGPVVVGIVAGYILSVWTRKPKRKPNQVSTGQQYEDPMVDGEGSYAYEQSSHIPYMVVKYPHDEMVSRSASFYQEMNKRRTVRFFSDAPFPKEVIHNIIKTAGTSPSGAHQQPWTYVLISDSDIKQQVRHIIEEEEMINYQRRMGETWLNDLKPFKTTWEKPYLTTAPYIVVIFKQVYGINSKDGSKVKHYYAEDGTCISVGLMLAAIQNAGLVTVTSTPMNAGPALRELLNRPMNEKVILLLPVGFPSNDATVPMLSRKSLEEMLVEV